MIRKIKTITGRLIGPRTVQLDQAVGAVGDRVEVTLAPATQAGSAHGQSMVQWLATLPTGNRSKADIDAQLAEERSSWGD